ncbi:FxsA family protein [Nocardioides marmoriginsengisoli]|uniref:FxsA family protein n=1 Tax=Nocardioides marmoriginsengisoli TaxID=661483 RepID=A0A3N0CR42_9ACTN|nr:FxsA family protein [Nocardioides marmoriginsengisoli]RNL65751.1 FxsA family protein [Nocardioides marmoriginsengisoli]
MSGQVRRRRFPWWLLLVAFIGIPIVEIYVLIQVGQVIGPWWTILLLIADSILGSWLLKREGARAWRALQVALAEGRMPARELADGILIVLGGTLMISPGFVTDIFGVLAILPLTRPLGRKVLAGFISKRLVVSGVPGMPRNAPGSAPRNAPGNAQRPGPSGDVVQGDVIESD